MYSQYPGCKLVMYFSTVEPLKHIIFDSHKVVWSLGLPLIYWYQNISNNSLLSRNQQQFKIDIYIYIYIYKTSYMYDPYMYAAKWQYWNFGTMAQVAAQSNLSWTHTS